MCGYNIVSVFGSNSNLLAKWPLALLSLFILLIHAIVPWVKNSQQFYRIQFGYAMDDKIVLSIQVLAMVLFLTLLSRLSLRSLQTVEIKTMVKPPRYFLGIVFFTYIVGAWLAVRDLNIIASAGGLDAYLNDRIGFGDDRGAARILGFVMITAAALFTRYFAANSTARNAAILVLMMGFPIYYFALLGSRNAIFLTVMLTLFMFIVSKKIDMRLNGQTIALLLGLVITVFGAGTVIYQTTQARYSLNDSRYLQERRDRIYLYSMDGAFGNDENAIWLQQDDYARTNGLSYLAALAIPVPRSLWEGKPVGGGPMLTNTIFPGKYEIGAEGVSSYTTGMVTEALLNFGFSGLFIITIAWVLSIYFFIVRAARATSVYMRTTWLIAIFYMSTAFVYSEFLGFVARVGVTVLPLLIIGFLQYIIGEKSQVTSRRVISKKKPIMNSLWYHLPSVILSAVLLQSDIVMSCFILLAIR